MRSVCPEVTADGVGIGTLNCRRTRFFAGFRNRNALHRARATRGDPVKWKTGRRTENRPETFYRQIELFAFTNVPSWYLSLRILSIHCNSLYAWFSVKPKVFPLLIFRIFLTLCELPYFYSYQVAEASKIHHQFADTNFECRQRGRTAINGIFIANRVPRFVNILVQLFGADPKLAKRGNKAQRIIGNAIEIRWATNTYVLFFLYFHKNCRFTSPSKWQSEF